MARAGQIDHVAGGLARVPEKLQGPRAQRYLAVYLAQFNLLEEQTQQILDAFVDWQVTGQTFGFVLATIGALLDQPRPDGFDDADYIFVLQARVLVRKSTATRDDVLRVAQYLARTGSVDVFFLAPKHVIVQFVDVTLDPQWQELYRSLLLDTIDAVDGLTIDYTTSASLGYDIGEYDEDLYA